MGEMEAPIMFCCRRAVLLLLLAVAVAAIHGDQNGEKGGNKPPRRDSWWDRQEMEACKDKASGTACSFLVGKHHISGSCASGEVCQKFMVGGTVSPPICGEHVTRCRPAEPPGAVQLITVGALVGAPVGFTVGVLASVGFTVGALVGASVGFTVGALALADYSWLITVGALVGS